MTHHQHHGYNDKYGYLHVVLVFSLGLSSCKLWSVVSLPELGLNRDSKQVFVASIHISTLMRLTITF